METKPKKFAFTSHTTALLPILINLKESATNTAQSVAAEAAKVESPIYIYINYNVCMYHYYR